MFDRQRNTLGPVLAYHGCDKSVAEKVLSHQADLQSSNNKYDWLGSGIYFWVDNPLRALRWAEEQQARGNLGEPYLVGAYIHLGLCLNLTDFAAVHEVRDAFNLMKDFLDTTGYPLPENKKIDSGTPLIRNLDCAVINFVHQSRELTKLPSYDTVLGVFEEGEPIYPGAGLKEKTHLQIAVRNPHVIVGYFRVRGL